MRLKNIFDISGVLAILIGLFFVFTEIKLSSTIARAELNGETNRHLAALQRQIYEPDMLEVWLKSQSAPEELTVSERFRLNIILSQVLQQYERECYYLSLDILVECEIIPRNSSLHVFGGKYGRAFWKTFRNRVRPSISKIVDEVLSENSSTDFLLQFDKEVLSNLD